jgi:tRNA A37 threonylcarbamoyladenosine modification protein TsaB
MFLFLDVASPIPEFHLIKDKKIINSIKVVPDNDQKLSDKIIPIYLEINNTYNLSKKVTNLIISIGPGSYTALRIGASFIAGLSQSMSLPVSVISSETIYDYLYDKNRQMCIYFESSNNQKFISYKRDSIFFHEKIENTSYTPPKFLNSVYYNLNIPKFNAKFSFRESFSIKYLVLNNLSLLDFKENLIIKPIYVSNKSLLN